MTETVVLDEIVFRIDVEALLDRVHVEKGSPDADEVGAMAARAEKVGRPKALYKVAYIDEKGDDFIVVDGVRLTSRVLRVNVEQAHRVFPHVATCGTELDEWARPITDPLGAFWADTIKRVVLTEAGTALAKHLEEHVRPGPISRMSPGSLEDWPIQEQRPLFRILGDPERDIGVRLTDSFLMVPTKSISGIHFPTEVRFESCQLCPRKVCPGRRAAYDQHLFETRYAKPPRA